MSQVWGIFVPPLQGLINAVGSTQGVALGYHILGFQLTKTPRSYIIFKTP